MELVFGSEAIRSYKRLAYKEWFAIAEFVDNSTQAYFDNQALLDEAFQRRGESLEVSIIYNRTEDTLTIKDNSIGMDAEELEAALMIAAHHPKENSRCRYGMGMKTSAIWLGEKWEIKTKKLGNPTEYSVTVDVEQVANGNNTLNPEQRPADDPDDHYTEVTIREMHWKINTVKISRIKQFLSSIYRCDIASGKLNLFWQNDPLTWEGFDNRILRDEATNNPYKLPLDFDVEGKRVHGWVAVLESGGRPYAGFSVLQNNRVIKGYPDAWRPASIFGQVDGSNDLINQRITGELNLDGFEVSHTKDEITFYGDEEDELQKKLAEACKPYIDKARSYRKNDKRQVTDVEVDDAVSQLVNDLSNEALVDSFNLFETPSPEVIEHTKKTIVDEAKRKPHRQIRVGDVDLVLRIDRNMSPNDPYCTLDISADAGLIVVVNLAHPYMVLLNNNLADYLRQCVFDGLAEWKASTKATGKVEPDRIRVIKDQLLRASYRIHDEPAPEATVGDVTDEIPTDDEGSEDPQ